MEQPKNPKTPRMLSELPNASDIKIIATDADNNLWDWVRPHALSKREMATKISFCTGIPYEEVVSSMKRVYTAADTLDYPKLVESMDVIQELIAKHAEKHLDADPKQTYRIRLAYATHEMVDLVDAARRASESIKEREFKLYPGIIEVFQSIVRNKIQIVILTNAPAERTIRRIKQFKLQDLIVQMFGLRQGQLQFDEKVTFEANEKGLKPYHDAIKEVIPYLGNNTHTTEISLGMYRPPYELIIMNDKEKKPDIDLARRFDMSEEEVKNQVAVWGDNPNSDMKLAVKNNCTGFYSDYGQTVDPEIRALLKEFASAKVVKRNLSPGEKAFKELREKHKKCRSKLIKLFHPIQILDKLGIRRPEKFIPPPKNK